MKGHTMNVKLLKILCVAFFLSATLNGQLSTAFAQGTAFTYQGQLQNNGSPASGTYNVSFSLFNNTNMYYGPSAGPVTNSSVIVSNGLFTTLVDFGPGVFTGSSNWLEVAVETNGGVSFTTLSPSQLLTPVPYAIMAESASNLLGTLPAAQLPGNVITNGQQNVTLSGTFSGNGTGLATVTASNYLFAASFHDQTAPLLNAFQAASFDGIGPNDPNGWTYAAGTFTCVQNGTYLILYDAEVQETAGGGGNFSLIATLNGTEIAGSESIINVGNLGVNTGVPVSKSFLVSFSAGQQLQIQFAGGAATDELVHGKGFAASQPSITCTIIRLF
jgi:hypothetical protein